MSLSTHFVTAAVVIMLLLCCLCMLVDAASATAATGTTSSSSRKATQKTSKNTRVGGSGEGGSTTGGKPGSSKSKPSSKTTVSSSPIKHIIVLMEENRSFDHFLGWNPKVNGLNGSEYNYANLTTAPNSKKVFVTKNAPNVGKCDPNHGLNPTTWKIFGEKAYKTNNLTDPCMCGFADYENYAGHKDTNYCGVLDMLTPDDLPVFTALMENFLVFDRFFAALPGPTWPNRIFTLSGTSAGLTETFPWYHDHQGSLYPQMTVFDQISQTGQSWKVYYNDTPWELFMETIAHHPEHCETMDGFYSDAKNGNLPNFAWINPRVAMNYTELVGANDLHPDHDVALGESYYKNIYEALRSSPQWNETLLIVTFDEHGGFYDHVPPPMKDIPGPGDGEASYPDKGFLFDRLGIRIPTLLISPWVGKGIVESAPPSSQKPKPSSEYDLTSILASVRKILAPSIAADLPPLTDRDAWAATFEHLIFGNYNQKNSSSNTTGGTWPRTDCPLHLPSPPKPARASTLDASAKLEAQEPINGLQQHALATHSIVTGLPYPHDILKQKDVGPWLQKTYRHHHHSTMAWKKSKRETREFYTIIVDPYNDKPFVSQDFIINQNRTRPTNTTSGSNATMKTIPFGTISIVLSSPTKKGETEKFCVQYETTTNSSSSSTAGPSSVIPKEMSDLSLSLCYPSADPALNRDTTQQFVFHKDATIRPYANSSLCVSARYFDGSPFVSLRPCSGSFEKNHHHENRGVTQHFGYGGKAVPGEGDDEGIIFGAYSLRWIVVKSSSLSLSLFEEGK